MALMGVPSLVEPNYHLLLLGCERSGKQGSVVVVVVFKLCRDHKVVCRIVHAIEAHEGFCDPLPLSPAPGVAKPLTQTF